MDSTDWPGHTLDELRLYFKANVAPMAESLGILGGLSFEQFKTKLFTPTVGADGSRQLHFVTIAEGVADKPSPKQTALLQFTVMAVWLQLGGGARSHLEELRNAMLVLIGYMRALIYSRDEHVKRGAGGRRLIGATTREKARRESAELRGRMSRDAAAPIVAAAIGRSPSTVRRLLSELFPGDEWERQQSDDSADSSG